MTCTDCGADLAPFQVPPAYREAVPGSTAAVGLCSRCLALQPVEDAPTDPNLDPLGSSFPTDPEPGVPMAILVGLLENLALYRGEIADLLAAVERAGTDPLLVLDRLATDPDIETDVDLAGRRRQLEQLL